MKALRTILGVLLVVAAAAPAAAAAPGDLDATFGVGGEVLARPGEEPPPDSPQPFGYYAEARSVITLRDGGLLASGVYYPPGPGVGALARFDSDGRPDRSFGSGGVAIVPLQVAEEPVEQPDGKLLVAGGIIGEDDRVRFAVARVLRDGRLDPSWAGDGIAETQLAPQGSWAAAVALGAGGRVYATGSETWRGGDAPYAGHAIARFLPDGSLDPGFGEGGVVRTGLGDRMTAPGAIVAQPRGGVLIGGGVAEGGRYWWMLARYDADGSRHAAFGDGGVARAPVGAPGVQVAAVQDILVDPAGRIVTAGTSNRVQGFSPIFTVARFRSDGTLDRSFADRGWTHAPLGSGSEAFALVRQPDGKLVAAGVDMRNRGESGTPGSAPVLVRYRPDGTLDGGFGEGGVVNRPYGTRFRGAYDLALQRDGRLVVAGGSLDCKRRVFALMRYLGDGGGVASPGPLIRLCSKDEVVAEDGSVTLPITCPVIFEVCKGTADVRVGRARVRGTFAVRGARVGDVRLRLRPALRRRLARARVLRARVTFRARTRGGHHRSTRRRIVLRAPG